MSNVLPSIKVSILSSILLALLTYRIVQWEIAIKINDLTMKAITLMAAIDHFQDHLIRQGPCWMLHLRAILIKLSISLSSHICHDNRVSHRLVTDHHYKSRAETQISLLARGPTRAPIKETKAEISTEIHSRSPSLLLKSTTLTTKKIRLQMIKRTISSTRIHSIITYLRKTFKSIRHL